MKNRNSLSQAELENLAYQREDIAEWRTALSDRTVAAVKKAGNIVGNHWLGLFNGLIGLLFVGTFLAPALQFWNLGELSRPLYWFYSWLCLQRPTHSFFLAGYQMGMEVRMVAINAGGLAASLLYTSGVGQKLAYRVGHWRGYFLLSLPVLVDVLTQTFNLRGSEWYWRGATGFLFGMATVWFFYPRLDKLARRFKTVS